ncbi:hypothetical protein D8674_009924 [Pyrus ussuriensis x Pyrus communis]|uniref:Uncharacterized protein n=1 Tax=Pyrus ussuriensis x Pyrus communis TaxID=2448454 RepID=A0A5N5FA38_9ROSA|nr:hypothetical protein D8674_009924 [Pyrus ussuriensis x Pyrus communis]
MKLAFEFRGEVEFFNVSDEMGKYQSEKEAALGRGKRLRKAVSFREAYATHPTETLSEVRDIPCGTKGGVMINFEKIEVRLCDIIL